MPRCKYSDFTLLCNRRGNQNCRGKVRSLNRLSRTEVGYG